MSAAVPAAPTPVKKKPQSSGTSLDPVQLATNLWDHYVTKTPQRTKLIDIFLLFLAVLGGVQLLYLILGGTYVR